MKKFFYLIAIYALVMQIVLGISLGGGLSIKDIPMLIEAIAAGWFLRQIFKRY